VRHGRVFRSDSLAPLSDSDIRYVVATLGLRTAVDLRAGHGLRADAVPSMRTGLLA
jgi:hypothetical protein